MSSIEGYVGARQLAPSEGRRLSRYRDNLAVIRQLRQGQIDVETAIAIDKIDGQTMATGIGLLAVSTVAAGQQSLEQVNPAATGRLALISDFHMFAVAGTLQHLQCCLQRI